MEPSSFDLNKFRSALSYNSLSIRQFAHNIGISETAMHKRLKNPDMFKYGEILSCEKILGKQVTTEIFFAD